MKATPTSKVNSAINLLRSGASIREIAQKLSLSGRPCVLTEIHKRYCVRKVTKDRVSNAAKVTKLLEEDHRIKVNPEKTVRRVLREAGLGAIEKQPKTLLSVKNIKKRLEWCREHKD
ncbi:hypothetical protein PS6_008576 [Mucor atramentarius]